MGQQACCNCSTSNASTTSTSVFGTDEWLFCEQEGFWAGGARALCRGTLFDRRGNLVATIMQEGLTRLRDSAATRRTPKAPSVIR
jgi:acyl-CoA thioesterase-2